MALPTDVRASAKLMELERNTGTIHINNLPQVTTCKQGKIRFLNPGKRGEKSATRSTAKESFNLRKLACFPTHGLMPRHILSMAVAIEFKGSRIILYENIGQSK